MNFLKKIKKELSDPIKIRVKTKRSFTIGNFIFLGKDRNDPDTIAHEIVHVKQQSGINNPFLNPSWLLRYFFDNNFRWRKEREALIDQVTYRQQHGIATDYNKLYSTILKDYNKMVDSNTARQFVKDLQKIDNIQGSIYLT